MMRKEIKCVLFLACVFLVLPHYTAYAGSSLKSMAREFTRAAQKNNTSRVAVLPFLHLNNPGSQEEKSIADHLITQLVRIGKVAVVERELLEKVMQEHRLAASGLIRSDGIKKLGEILPVDAILTGSFSSTGDKLDVHARMIDVETGRVLFASNKRFKRKWPMADADLIMSPLKSDIPAPRFEAAIPGLSTSEKRELVCAQAQVFTKDLYRAILDLKARYWAVKFKESDISIARLSRTPGSDIPDRSLRMWFYDLLKSWYYREHTPRLTPSELKKIMRVEERIRQITDVCS